MKRIHTLQQKLKHIEKHRSLLSKNRKFKVIGLVGYTNAGKSTLLNSLANENLKTENRLFVTLDSTIRKVYLEYEKYVLIFDTIGFIKNLPHDLNASFHATLKEIQEADLILHIVDCQDRNYESKINTVNSVLFDLDVDVKNTGIVFNKIDMLDKERIKNIENKYTNSIFISGKEKINLEKLKQYILFRTRI